MIGTILDDKYEISGLIGEGGMGSVWEAKHTATGRRCAVKVIISEELTQNQQVVSRFQREARAAGAIDTQYITQVLDAGVDRHTGHPFLVMEYMDGEDLHHLLKRLEPVSPDLALRVIAQACLGLQKAHEETVVHRDIKPHNLFLAKRDAGEVVIKILDFGIAKVKMEEQQSTESAGLTKEGSLLGSPLYVSPEQARGKKEIDHRTDIWSLGAVLYQMLAGRTPYQHATALGELILMICTEPPPPIQDHAGWVAPEIAEIVHHCLQFEQADRYQTAQELFEAIRPHLPYGWTIHEDMLVSLEDSQQLEMAPRLPFSVPPPAMLSAQTTGSTTGGATTGGALAHSQQAVPQSSSASKWAIALGAVAVLAATGGGVFAVTRQSDDAQQPKPAVTQVITVVQTASAKPTASAEVQEQKPIRVRVVVIPDDAEVEVEGKAVEAKNGILEITGVLGSVHKVVIKKGGGETEADVVVTQTGALPAKLEVKVGKKVKIPRAGAKPPDGSPSATSKEPSAPKTVPKAIATNTDEFG